MAKFRYRMQNILNIKEKLEEQEKQNFALMLRKLDEEEEKLEMLRDRLALVTEEGTGLRLTKLDVLAIKENTAMRKYLEDEIKSQVVRVRAAEKNLENARIRMQQAIQERKIHEKLRERAYDDFLKGESAREAGEIDELTSYVYGNRK